ncbi:MAG TPA: hypothetical protein DCG89_08410 [Spartobacteria bacterium]|jgi:hypothetical protein|nr:hypothetical protein [Spartobacteria bacterium]
MKTYLTFSLLIMTVVAAIAAPQTLTAPITPRGARKPAPAPPIYKKNVQGVVPRAVRGGNPLQMLNPRAPAKYGTWVESTSFDPNIPGKWKGIKLFEIWF